MGEKAPNPKEGKKDEKNIYRIVRINSTEEGRYRALVLVMIVNVMN